MASERAPGPWWEPTWRRLVGSTVVLFLVILAFLVGRVRSGADPALAGSTDRPVQQGPALNNGGSSGNGFDPQNQGVAPQGQGIDPNDPFADPQGQGVDPSQVDPSTGGGDDNFGNAVPDQSGGSQQQLDPPSTHVS